MVEVGALTVSRSAGSGRPVCPNTEVPAGEAAGHSRTARRLADRSLTRAFFVMRPVASCHVPSSCWPGLCPLSAAQEEVQDSVGEHVSM